MARQYASRTDRWKNMTQDQKKLQNARRIRWKIKNPERMLLANTRNRATKYGIPFNLELSDIVIPEYCPALGIKLERGDGRPTDYSPSIDKIIPALGYTKGNIIIVSWRANRVKSNVTPDEIVRIGNFYKSLPQEQVAPV